MADNASAIRIKMLLTDFIINWEGPNLALVGPSNHLLELVGRDCVDAHIQLTLHSCIPRGQNRSLLNKTRDLLSGI